MLSDNMGVQFPNVPSANGVGPNCGHAECNSNFLNHPPEVRLASIAKQSGFNQNDTGGYTPKHASGQLTPAAPSNYVPRHDDSEDEDFYKDSSGNDLRY